MTIETASTHNSRRIRRVRPCEQNGRTVVVPADVLDRLAPHAERRGVTINALVRQLLETVVDDGIVDAILDDDI